MSQDNDGRDELCNELVEVLWKNKEYIFNTVNVSDIVDYILAREQKIRDEYDEYHRKIEEMCKVLEAIGTNGTTAIDKALEIGRKK